MASPAPISPKIAECMKTYAPVIESFRSRVIAQRPALWGQELNRLEMMMGMSQGLKGPAATREQINAEIARTWQTQCTNEVTVPESVRTVHQPPRRAKAKPLPSPAMKHNPSTATAERTAPAT